MPYVRGARPFNKSLALRDDRVEGFTSITREVLPQQRAAGLAQVLGVDRPFAWAVQPRRRPFVGRWIGSFSRVGVACRCAAVVLLLGRSPAPQLTSPPS